MGYLTTIRHATAARTAQTATANGRATWPLAERLIPKNLKRKFDPSTADPSIERANHRLVGRHSVEARFQISATHRP
jgi:hypothetical protein